MNRRSSRNRHRTKPIGPTHIRPKEIVIDRAIFEQFARLGARAMDLATAQAVWATAQRMSANCPAGPLAVIAATGAVVSGILDVIGRHVASAPEGGPKGSPGTALPAWAVDLLRATGQVQPPADPPGGPGAAAAGPLPPVQSDLDLAQRAARIGLVLARWVNRS